MKFKEFWDNAQATYSTNGEEYSSWLDKYAEKFSRCGTKVLDLGCGIGYDSEYLNQKGLEVIACDFSEVALKRLKERVPSVNAMLLDISEHLPFEDNSFNLIIADLSLHYFDEKTTEKRTAAIHSSVDPHPRARGVYVGTAGCAARLRV